MLENLAVVIDDPGVGDAGNFLRDNWPLMGGAAVIAMLFLYFKDMTIKKVLGAIGIGVILMMIVPQIFGTK